MKFFVPGIQDSVDLMIFYWVLSSEARFFALSVTDRKIYSILYKRRKLFNFTVGKPDPIKGEIVLAIFESSVCYLAYTLSRGVDKGDPYVIGDYEVLSIEDFDPE